MTFKPDRRDNIPGTIYVIHFHTPLSDHASHYVGWSENGVWDRLVEHARGRGAKIMRAVMLAGIAWEVTAMFPGTRNDERRIKNTHHRERWCPTCSPGMWRDRQPFPVG